MKAIMISINPKWVAKILNGEKTLEIRKTCPALYSPYDPIDVYIYCTKDRPYLTRGVRGDVYPSCVSSQGIVPHHLNGKVVAKFTLNKVEEIKNFACFYNTKNISSTQLETLSCLTFEELNNYLKGKIGYIWHIDNLVIFDKPKELSEFKYYKKFSEIDYMLPIPRKETCERLVALTRAPQSWQFIEI